MGAGQRHLTAALRDVAINLGDDFFRSDAALPPANFGDDAVSAYLVAALLDLHHGTGASHRFFGGVRPLFFQLERDRLGLDMHVRFESRMYRFHRFHQRALAGVADDQGRLRQPFQIAGSTLGVAPGGDHHCARVAAAGSAQELAGLCVRGGSYGASVEDHHICGVRWTNHTVPRLNKLPGKCLAVGLVQLAAVRVNRYGARWRFRSGSQYVS